MVILNFLAARGAHRARARPRRARKLRRSFSEIGYIREFGFTSLTALPIQPIAV